MASNKGVTVAFFYCSYSFWRVDQYHTIAGPHLLLAHRHSKAQSCLTWLLWVTFRLNVRFGETALGRQLDL